MYSYYVNFVFSGVCYVDDGLVNISKFYMEVEICHVPIITNISSAEQVGSMLRACSGLLKAAKNTPTNVTGK